MICKRKHIFVVVLLLMLAHVVRGPEPEEPEEPEKPNWTKLKNYFQYEKEMTKKEPVETEDNEWDEMGTVEEGGVSYLLEKGDVVWFAFKNTSDPNRRKYFQLALIGDGAKNLTLVEKKGFKDGTNKEVIKPKNVGPSFYGKYKGKFYMRRWRFRFGPPQPKWERFKFKLTKDMEIPSKSITVRAWSICCKTEAERGEWPEMTDLYPPDGAVEIDRDDDLCWPESKDADSYDVYFGTDFDDVKYGRRGTFKGNTTARTYDPGTLERCYDYYWRVEPLEEEEEEIIVDWVVTTGDVRIYADVFKFGDVWSFTTVGREATKPYPVNGAIHVDPNAILSWTPGCFAAFNDVYFGTDFDAVANADTSDTTGTYRGRQAVDANSYDPGGLEPGTTYHWKIHGVNEPTPEWQGEIWSFTTADCLFLDDMESYTDDLGNRIFETWIDGWGYGEPPFGHPGNGTGSTIALGTSWMDDPVRAGAQSMLLHYDNSGHIHPGEWRPPGWRPPKPPPDPNSDPNKPPKPPPDPNKPPPDPNKPPILKACYSETERTFLTPQDWSGTGIGILSLWFYGDPDNAPEPMYVAVEDTTGMSAVVVHDNPAAAQTDTWTEWSIDLRQFADQGMNLADVSSIAIGFGDRYNPTPGGTGILYFDDIRLCESTEETEDCGPTPEELTPPLTPEGYVYIGYDVVVNFQLTESTIPLDRPESPEDISVIRGHTIVKDGVTVCDVIVTHVFAPKPKEEEEGPPEEPPEEPDPNKPPPVW